MGPGKIAKGASERARERKERVSQRPRGHGGRHDSCASVYKCIQAGSLIIKRISRQGEGRRRESREFIFLRMQARCTSALLSVI